MFINHSQRPLHLFFILFCTTISHRTRTHFVSWRDRDRSSHDCAPFVNGWVMSSFEQHFPSFRRFHVRWPYKFSIHRTAATLRVTKRLPCSVHFPFDLASHTGWHWHLVLPGRVWRCETWAHGTVIFRPHSTVRWQIDIHHPSSACTHLKASFVTMVQTLE